MTVTEYYHKMKGLADTMATVGHPLHDDEVIGYIMTGIGPEFDPLMASLTVPNTTVSLHDFYAFPLSFEAQMAMLVTVVMAGVAKAMAMDVAAVTATVPNANFAPDGSHGGYHVGNSTSTGDAHRYADMGATDHLTNNLDRLTVHKHYTGKDQVQVDNGADVLYVPHISRSLLSYHKLIYDNNALVEFHWDSFFVKNTVTRKTILQGRSHGGLYPIPFGRASSLSPRHAFAGVKETTHSASVLSGLALSGPLSASSHVSPAGSALAAQSGPPAGPALGDPSSTLSHELPFGLAPTAVDGLATSESSSTTPTPNSELVSSTSPPSAPTGGKPVTAPTAPPAPPSGHPMRTRLKDNIVKPLQ
ncbi:uncharacterized protein LOC133892278 [Phragmites australis]|uniref:uncharacterized protein LOC133892278 n=1 Tax=Phragmites australis TaxID=29695 RepID=UPI002D76EABA|nr:uncharacterized protein LOC133892278 [Phragmites australis]